jgi:hypothetical protein
MTQHLLNAASRVASQNDKLDTTFWLVGVVTGAADVLQLGKK